MVTASETSNPESLLAWLKDRPQKEAVTVAVRAALRAAPIFWEWVGERAQDPAVSELSLCRSLLISAVAAVRPTANVANALDIPDAAAAAIAASAAGDHRASSAARAAADAAAAVLAEAEVACHGAVKVVQDAADESYLLSDGRRLRTSNGSRFVPADAARYVAAVWHAARRDCEALERGADPFLQPLWEDQPHDLYPELPHVAWPSRGRGWQFWHDWYEGYLTGRPLDLDLLEQVALIPSGDWDAGESAVDLRIERILLDHAADRARSGITVSINPETALFRQEDVQAQDRRAVAQAVGKLREIDALAETSGNLMGVLRAEFFLIRRAVNEHAENPVMLYFNCKAARDILQGNLANGSCPSIAQEPVVGVIDATLADVQAALWTEPEVRATVEKRADDSSLLDNPAALKAIEVAADEVANASEGQMAEELPKDARLAGDPHQPRALRVVALLGAVSRLVQVWGTVAYRGLLAGLDQTEHLTRKVAVIAENTEKITGSAAKTTRNLAVIAATTSSAVIYVSLNTELISQAIHQIGALF